MSVPRDANLRELVVAERAVASRCKKNFQTIQTIKSYCSNHNFACLCLCWWISSGIACIGDTECFTFNQNFWMFGESRKWYRNFPEKIPGNCWISKMQTIELKILEILGEKLSGKKTATRNTFRIFLQPARLLPNGRSVARGAQGKSMGDQISVQGARAGAWLNTRH